MQSASRQNRTDFVFDWILARIRGGVYRPGARLPSIRGLAEDLKVSPFTVAAAYDRLNAEGAVVSRPGSGVFVKPAPVDADPARAGEAPPVDVDWLLGHMLSSASVRGPGAGVFPSRWLDGEGIAAGLRGLGREGADRWLGAGSAYGFEPLRRLAQSRSAFLDIVVGIDQIVLTTGVTQALELTLRRLTEPGDAVLVFTPAWFGALAMLAMHRLRVMEVPYTPDGPDLDLMARVVAEVRPKLMIVGATAHNPTGLTLSQATVDRMIDIANAHGVAIFEDDVYCDLGSPAAPRFAARNRAERLVYAGSWSKTLAGNIRVGFLATDATTARALAGLKTLAGFTTPELNERLIFGLVRRGRYDRHVATLNARLAKARADMIRLLTDRGFDVFGAPASGLFLWVDMKCDTIALAAEAKTHGQLVAPGALFSSASSPSTHMRVNVATPPDAGFATVLRLAAAARG